MSDDDKDKPVIPETDQNKGSTCSTPGCNNPVYIGTMCKECAGR
jgi:hypothetical protein